MRSGFLERVPFDRVVVAIDPGKAAHRVWVTNADGVVGEPATLPSTRSGIEQLARLVGAVDPVIALEETGALHRAWAVEIQRRWPGSLRVFAPSERLSGIS